MKKKLLRLLRSTSNYKAQFDQLKQNSSFKKLTFIVLFVIFAYLFISQSLTIVQLGYDMGKQKTQMEEMATQNKLLAEKVEQKTTDSYIEESARKKLSMVKSGEKPVQVEEVENKVVQESNEKIKQKDKMSIYMTDWYVYVDKMIEDVKKN